MPGKKKGQPPNQSKAVKKRQYASRTPQARALQKKIDNPKMVEAGVGAYAAVRLAQAGMKAAKKAVAKQNKAANTYKTVDPKRSEAAKKAAKTRAANEKARLRKAEGRGAKKGIAAGTVIGGAFGENRRRDKKGKK